MERKQKSKFVSKMYNLFHARIYIQVNLGSDVGVLLTGVPAPQSGYREQSHGLCHSASIPNALPRRYLWGFFFCGGMSQSRGLPLH